MAAMPAAGKGSWGGRDRDSDRYGGDRYGGSKDWNRSDRGGYSGGKGSSWDSWGGDRYGSSYGGGKGSWDRGGSYGDRYGYGGGRDDRYGGGGAARGAGEWGRDRGGERDRHAGGNATSKGGGKRETFAPPPRREDSRKRVSPPAPRSRSVDHALKTQVTEFVKLNGLDRRAEDRLIRCPDGTIEVGFIFTM